MKSRGFSTEDEIDEFFEKFCERMGVFGNALGKSDDGWLPALPSPGEYRAGWA
jgi:hypothetical protein